jgi:hypothetical protein
VRVLPAWVASTQVCAQPAALLDRSAATFALVLNEDAGFYAVDRRLHDGELVEERRSGAREQRLRCSEGQPELLCDLGLRGAGDLA